MSRRQTLGVLSPNQLAGNGARTTGATSAAGRVASKEQPPGLSTVKARKSLAPDKAAAILLANGANLNGSSVGGGQQVNNAGYSGAGIDPRRSSAYNKGASNAGPKADPRPLNDKNFQANCVRIVITYLSTHGYPAAVSPKTLSSPTAKEFTMIVQFLQQQFDPNLKTFGKIEEDVPLFFKRLNYPFQISRSALFAVGSPHSWPAVLAALTWLVELLNYNERVESSGQGNSFQNGPGVLEDQEAATKRQFYEYICTSYKFFLAGDDEKCAVVDNEMLSQFSIKERQLLEAHERIKQQSEAVLAEIQRMRSEPSPLAVAQQRRAERCSDAEKFQQLIDNLQGMKTSLTRKMSERQEELAARQEALAGVAKENEALRQRIAAQPVNKADLSRMQMERSKQKEVLEAVTVQAEDLEAKVHQQEVHVVAMLKSLEAQVSRFNQTAHRLKLVPASSKRAAGVTYELRLARDATTAADFSNVDLKCVVKPGLEHLLEAYRVKGLQLNRDLLALKEEAAGGHEALQDKGVENRAMEGMIAKLEQQLAAAREVKEEHIRGLGVRAEQVAQEVDGLRLAASQKAADMESRKAAVLAEYDNLQIACEADLTQLRAQLRSALELMLQHRVAVQQQVQAALAAVQAAKQDMMRVPVPAVQQ